VDNLRMLTSSVESELARKREKKMEAESTEPSWFVTLTSNLSKIEGDTEEAFKVRRELTALLVGRVLIGRGEERRPEVDAFTYRFGPSDDADGVQNSEERMAAHEGRVPAVMLGVGAAFDFHTGRVAQAPRWMQAAGLEWVFRLLMDPRRLWKRYAKHNPRFVALFLMQLLGLRRFGGNADVDGP
jgi:hypothetical protein